MKRRLYLALVRNTPRGQIIAYAHESPEQKTALEELSKEWKYSRVVRGTLEDFAYIEKHYPKRFSAMSY